VEECGPCPVFASFTLAFDLQLRKKHGKNSVGVRKTSIRLRKTSVRVQHTYYQNTHTLQNPHKHTQCCFQYLRPKTNRLTRTGEVMAICSYSRTKLRMWRCNLVPGDACGNPCAKMLRSITDFYVRKVSVRWVAQYWMVCKARYEGQVLLELERQRLTLKYILRYSSYRAVNTRFRL
jgi:hypothetical protein